MTARTTMADLITELRGMCNAGTADVTIAGTTYWTDDQLQKILDRNRLLVDQEPLYMVPSHVPGSVEYYEYRSCYDHYEQTDGGSAVFLLEDSTGANIGTALWDADYNTGVVTFAANTAGTTYYLTGRSYDLNGAAAEVWRQKASYYAATSSGVDWSTDNMRISRSQMVTQAQGMANYYAGLARPRTVSAERGDMVRGGWTKK
jgi:hypothetical protein